MENLKNLIAEFSRYILVGGSSFVIDFAAMYIFQEFIFKGSHVFIAVFIGYMVGLIYNFFLSSGYVFKNGFEKIKGKEIQSFIIVTIIGIMGLGFTEALMYLFVNILMLHYLIGKVLSGGIVLFWNYIGRKIIVYK